MEDSCRSKLKYLQLYVKSSIFTFETMKTQTVLSVPLNPEGSDAGLRGTGEVCRMVGCSERQLQWWDEKGIVKPIQIKHARGYSDADISRLRIVLRLRKCGFGLSVVRRLLKTKPFQMHFPYVLTDGKVVIGALDADEAIAAMRNSRKRLVLVECEVI